MTINWPRGTFVTGTDTGVGKTVVAVALMSALRSRGLSVVGMKPVASGSAHTAGGLRNADALALQAAGTTWFEYSRINPYAFEPAIAPHIAAAETGVRIDIPHLVSAYRWLAERVAHVVVEGAGGWRVPIGPAALLSDLPAALDLDVLMVVGLRLGCLSHALLTAEAIERSDRLRLIGWVGNTIEEKFQPFDENAATLRRLLPCPCLGILPHLADLDHTLAATALQLEAAAV
jgi:dethiobiotin synthetase